MTQLLSTLLVSRFYKINAGFFLFLFIILFGILPGTDTLRLHTSLMIAATSSPVYALVAMVIFALYNFKCASFSYKELEKPENSFLVNLQCLSNVQQLSIFLAIHASLYFPVLVYGIITAFVGFRAAHYPCGMLILAWSLLMPLTGAYISFYKLNTTWLKPVFTLPVIRLFHKKGFYSYLLHYSLNSKKGAFIGIKIFSLLALQFMVALNAGKASRENVCFLILLCISAHALLPAYYVQFVEGELGFLRNTPLSLMKRLGLYTGTYSVIFIPELLFLIWNEHSVLPLAGIISLYLLAIARLTLYTSLQYLNGY